MEKKKHGFWFVLIISVLVYAGLKILRTVLKVLFGAVWLFMEFSLLPIVPFVIWAAIIAAVIITVKKSGSVYAFPLAVLAIEFAYDVKAAVKSSDTLSTITETADSLGWFNETILTVIDSVGAGGRILYIGYCFLNSLVLFGALLLISAIAKIVFDKRKKKS